VVIPFRPCDLPSFGAPHEVFRYYFDPFSITSCPLLGFLYESSSRLPGSPVLP